MKKWTRVFLCAAIVVLAASGCKKEEIQESTEAPTETSVPEETEAPTMAELPEASVTLGEYKGIVVEDPYVEITDEDVEARITQALAANPKQPAVMTALTVPITSHQRKKHRRYSAPVCRIPAPHILPAAFAV